jgi:hypothetical protein
MKASVVKLNYLLPTAEAVTSNHIAVAFAPPSDRSVSLSHELDIDLERLDVEQEAINLTTGMTLHLTIRATDVHDLQLPARHGSSRFPSLARRRGG